MTCVPTVNWTVKIFQVHVKAKSIFFCDERSAMPTFFHKAEACHRVVSYSKGLGLGMHSLGRECLLPGEDNSLKVEQRQIWCCLGKPKAQSTIFARKLLAVLLQRKDEIILCDGHSLDRNKLFFLYKYKICPSKSSTNVILGRYQYTLNHKHIVFPSSFFCEFIEMHELK